MEDGTVTKNTYGWDVDVAGYFAVIGVPGDNTRGHPDYFDF